MAIWLHGVRNEHSGISISKLKLTRLRQPGTLTWQDVQTGQMRNEAKIHVIRLNETVKDIQDLDIAQQYEPAKRKGRLFKIANEAVKAYFGPRPGQKEYVSCLYLDTKWDKKVSKMMDRMILNTMWLRGRVSETKTSYMLINRGTFCSRYCLISENLADPSLFAGRDDSRPCCPGWR